MQCEDGFREIVERLKARIASIEDWSFPVSSIQLRPDFQFQFKFDEDASPCLVVSELMASELALRAKVDFEAYDYAVGILQHYLLFDTVIPNPLKIFAVELITGKVKRPNPPFREPKKNFGIQFMQMNLVIEGLLSGLNLTRNDVSEETSACDAVAVALTELGISTQYQDVKNLCVHPAKKKTRKKIEELTILEFGVEGPTLENAMKHARALKRAMKTSK